MRFSYKWYTIHLFLLVKFSNVWWLNGLNPWFSAKPSVFSSQGPKAWPLGSCQKELWWRLPAEASPENVNCCVMISSDILRISL